MSFKAKADVPVDVCGTFYAAKVLGLAVATVHALVDRGELEAWRTKGGHRRITMPSIKAYLDQHGAKGGPESDTHSPFLRVLVVDDDPVALELFRAAVESWNLPIDCTYMSSAMEALMDMASMRPDVLVSDLMMPGIDGFELLRTIRANPVFAGLLMLVVTSLPAEDIAARGGLPKHTQVVQKPLSMDWLQGFMAALVRSKELQADR
jgi:excisionase family DNA binding protein